MNQIITFSILLFISTLSLTAQPRGGRPGGGFNAEEMAQREKENVLRKVEQLSADQTELINGIYDEFGETVSETFEEVRKTRNFSEMRTKMQGLRKEKDLLMKDILNEEQYETYLKVAESSRPKRPDGANGRTNGSN
ncbi:MAG: hypothetical protein AAGA66_06980 [Bacteroidota bacterium]